VTNCTISILSEVSCNRRYRPVVCCFHIDRVELLLTEVLQWTI
jgi:hypothetical protein